MHSDSCSSKAFSTKASLQPYFVCLQLNFKPSTLNNCSIILQYSKEIGWPQEHFSSFPLHSWQIGWRFKHRYHRFSPGLAWPLHSWQTNLFRTSVTVLPHFSKNEAIFSIVKTFRSALLTLNVKVENLSNWSQHRTLNFKYSRADVLFFSAKALSSSYSRLSRALLSTQAGVPERQLTTFPGLYRP